MSNIKDIIFNKIEEYKEEAIGLSDYLADNPELSGEEFVSSEKHCELLKSHGFAVEKPFVGWETAYRAIYGKNDHKHKIALLAEYDALPEIGHACGHCVSGAASVLAAMAMKDLQDEIDADIHVLGTPAEETDGAKCVMEEEGIFDEYDMAMMVHMNDHNEIQSEFLALVEYFYDFYGKAAHAASAPWEGINAFNAAQIMIHASDVNRQHLKPDVRIHSIIRECGSLANIVPDFTRVDMGIRSKRRDYLKEVIEKMDHCAEAGAIATGARWEKTSVSKLYCDLRHNRIGEEAIKEAFEELGLEVGEMQGDMGSSDIGNASYHCPTFHPMVQAVESGTGLHTPEFGKSMKSPMAHDALVNASRLIAVTLINIFTNEDKIRAMKEEFEREDN